MVRAALRLPLGRWLTDWHSQSMNANALTHVRRLMAGNGLAQALQFLSILLLSRLYAPDDFGLLAQVQSIATFAAIVATLQMHLVVPLSGDGEQARRAAATAQTVCVVLLLAALPIAAYFGQVALAAVMLAAMIGLSNTYTSVLVFRGDFRRLSVFYVTRALLIIALQVTFALLSVPDGLLWAGVAGEACAATYLRLRLSGESTGGLLAPSVVGGMLRRWRAFSLHGTVQEAVSVMAFYAPVLWFTALHGEDVGGQYAMASRLIWAPVVLVSSSVAQVLYHSFGQQSANGSLDLSSHLTPKVGLVLVFACAVTFALQPLFHTMLGVPWELASRMMPLHVLWGAAFLLSTPFRVACRVLQLQRLQLFTDALALCTVALIFVVLQLTPMQLMWTLVGVSVVQHGILSSLVWRAARLPRPFERPCGASIVNPR